MGKLIVLVFLKDPFGEFTIVLKFENKK